jgi:drug/metabolite transporter (DMT)-like permease
VGTYAFVNPVVALALAWAVGDEPFSVRTVVAATIVLGAVVLIWKSSGVAAGRRHFGPFAEPVLSATKGSG